MADYKEMLGGTIGRLAGKVRNAADSTGVLDVYSRGADRAKAFAQVTKLTLALNNDLEERKKVYAEIGRLYYEQHAHSPEGLFAPLFDQVEKLTDSVSEKQRRIDELKAHSLGESDGLDDFDQLVSAAEDEAKNG